MALATIQSVSTAESTDTTSRVVPIQPAAPSAAPSDQAKANGTFKTKTPPVINPEKAKPIVFSGKDAEAFLAALLAMIGAIQEVEGSITGSMLNNSKNQQGMANLFVTVMKNVSTTVLKKMDEAIQEAEEAKKDSHSSWILGIVVGCFCALAALVTFGATAALMGVIFTVMFALPDKDNPLKLGAQAISSSMGAPDWVGDLIMIVIVVAAIVICGAGVGALAPEAAEAGAQAGANGAGEAAEEEAENDAASSFTKQAVAQTTRNVATDAFSQTFMMLNPIGEALKDVKGKYAILAQILGTILTVVIAMLAMKYGGSSEGANMGIKGLSQETAATIGKWCTRLAAAAAITEGGFNIAAGVAKDKQADALDGQAAAQRILSLVQGLLKMVESSIQQNNKQQQTVGQSFQEIGGNFADLASPFRYIAEASQVLA